MLIHPTPSNILAFSTTIDSKLEVPVTAPLFLPSHQVHGTKMFVIEENFLTFSPLEQVLTLHGVDALCTSIPNVCIGVKTADCIPILLYNNENTVIAAVHAGWKGTVRRIVDHSIGTLVQQYGIDPQQLHAIIGPGISLDSFEVGNEVHEQFQAADFPMEKIAKRYPAAETQEKWHIDLWEANRLLLIGQGVKAENIHVCGIDSMTNPHFFSARRIKECPGRIINGIIIK